MTETKLSLHNVDAVKVSKETQNNRQVQKVKIRAGKTEITLFGSYDDPERMNRKTIDLKVEGVDTQ